MKVLISTCLLGEPCRYDGLSKPCPQIATILSGQELFPACPEVLGGLPVPRPPAEIDRSERTMRVRRQDGTDVTASCLDGAEKAVRIAKDNGCRLAVLRSKSPACGSDRVYDGTFTGTLVPGAGVAARALRDAGIRVISEDRLVTCIPAVFAASSLETPPLETERLILRPLTDDDAGDVFEYSHDPAVGIEAGWEPHRSIEDSLSFIDMVASAPHVFGIVDRGSGKVIGSIGLVRDSLGRTNTDCLMLGYALAREWWGRGLMTEAACRVIRYGFSDLGLELIVANRYPENARSGRVLEKCGFHCEGTLREVEMGVDGTMRDAISYSLTRREFQGAAQIPTPPSL